VGVLSGTVRTVDCGGIPRAGDSKDLLGVTGVAAGVVEAVVLGVAGVAAGVVVGVVD